MSFTFAASRNHYERVIDCIQLGDGCPIRRHHVKLYKPHVPYGTDQVPLAGQVSFPCFRYNWRQLEPLSSLKPIRAVSVSRLNTEATMSVFACSERLPRCRCL